ncbi:hypothetical protein BT93_L2978 [Corymbia citriodora subsp. variegata]|uniref:Uncharacterized protein n=1 Tax=Corymbia citriodora subsp. variegata TaxID=360336 RepID=A0A8T0CJL1_CORYI|nr:hypothetical protein BT93_L2978 [Corymbia citriodora subsp. variegata]KAF7847424.1 hypothetical protein BT93_L2978 [Corymbia citriodora subsp. variegata]
MVANTMSSLTQSQYYCRTIIILSYCFGREIFRRPLGEICNGTSIQTSEGL